MMVDRPLAKQAARNCMRTARVSPYQIALIYILITFALSIFDQAMVQLFGVPYYLDAYTSVLMPSGINWFVSIMVALIGVLLQAGFSIYCLAVRRGREMPATTLFDGFSMAGKIILLYIVTSIFIFLWCLLFIIPGIIAAYRYRFALYNILENPDLGILEAINISREQTAGYKWQLFVLDLSFLGWLILDVFTLGFLGIWLVPYMTLTDIAFYDTIRAQKGMGRPGSQQQNWQQNAPNPNNQQNYYDYDWNHNNNQWNTPPQQGGNPYGQPQQPYQQPPYQQPQQGNPYGQPQAPYQPQQPQAPQQQTPPQAPPAEQSPSAPQQQDDAPRQNADPWAKDNNTDPWNRNNPS